MLSGNPVSGNFNWMVLGISTATFLASYIIAHRVGVSIFGNTNEYSNLTRNKSVYKQEFSRY
jgi:hypothetical protein